MSLINDIQTNITTVLNTITIANGYSVDVKYVDDVILSLEHISPERTQAAVAIEWLGEEIASSPDQADTSTSRWSFHIGMKNASFLKFTDFYEDVKRALNADPTRNGKALYTYVRSADTVNSAEKAEDRYREANLIVEVIYEYEIESL